jgi:hypothetical protein
LLGAKVEKTIFMNRKIDMQSEKTQIYKIVDDPTKLSPNEWEYVVAAFVTGYYYYLFIFYFYFFNFLILIVMLIVLFLSIKLHLFTIIDINLY